MGISSEMEASFQKHLVEAWYPKTVDSRYGGFLTGFEADWTESEGQTKFIVGQARHIWVLSQLAVFLDDSSYAELAEKGMRFLVDKMWDSQFGGFYELVSRDGRTVRSSEKSAYGMSFAIYALSSLHAATGDSEALEYAKKSFRWMEEHSWDEEFSGYVSSMDRAGAWAPGGIDAFDTLGSKDYNSSIHMLEALTSLYGVWPDELVKRRLEGMLTLVRDTFVHEKGYLILYFERNWTPVSFRGKGRSFALENNAFDHVSWGHDVETAFLMLEASHVLGYEKDERTLSVAKRLVDHALETGWDSEYGSFFDGGYYFEENGECEVIRPQKVWWVAGEGLNALLLMSQLFPEDPRYRNAFEKQWRYMKTHLFDERHGGWFGEGADSDPDASRRRKAHRWKASYHDGRTYMNCLKMLKGQYPLTQH
ncbi:hypothetical protein VDG1235_4368 [Verrucomicrobiia bacterium DG1235]|nr:hypothetical protein VDG1235_4368 [Verrucomicrobiae bacterium DG1235]